LSGTAAQEKWTAVSVNGMTLYAGTSTIILTNSTANAQTFNGNGYTYNNVTVQGAGAYALTISGNNTFGTFTVDRSVAAKTITGTAGSIQTIASFVCAESSTRVLTLNSTGAAWTLTKSGGGEVDLNYLAISYVNASPSPTWYYGANSSIANSTGWYHSHPSDTMQAIWNVRKAISDSIQLVWNAALAVGATALRIVWHTRASISDSLQLVWNARKAISDSVQLIWHISIMRLGNLYQTVKLFPRSQTVKTKNRSVTLRKK
jgi:hypothetical protein